ncbi:MAG: hypothetical protein HYX83_03255 [Chloroflexi bacterium]|nr:hypothetical protein [Chloroflexota bacterium]
MLALLGAMKEETTGLQKRMKVEETLTNECGYLCRGSLAGKALVLMQTGVGKERAEAATKFVLSSFPVSALVSIGFAGALIEESRVGDVVICSELHYAGGLETRPQLQLSGEPCFSDAILVSLASQSLEDAGVRFRQGNSLTVPEAILSPETKQALGRALPVDIAEMESYWIARMARDRHIPFLAIRTVSDTAQERLSSFSPLMAVYFARQWGRVAIYLLTHPHQWMRVFQLSRNVRQAGRSLTTAVERFLSQMRLD